MRVDNQQLIDTVAYGHYLGNKLVLYMQTFRTTSLVGSKTE